MNENKHISKDRILFEFIPGLIIWAILIFGAYFMFSSPNSESEETTLATESEVEPKKVEKKKVVTKKTVKKVTTKKVKKKQKTTETKKEATPVATENVVDVPPKNKSFATSTTLLYPKEGANIFGAKIDFRWKSSSKDFSYFKVVLISPNKSERTLATTRKQSFTWTFDEPQSGSKYEWKILTISKKQGTTETTVSETGSFLYKMMGKKKKEPIALRSDNKPTKVNKTKTQLSEKKATETKGQYKFKYNSSTEKSKSRTESKRKGSKRPQDDSLEGKAEYVSDKK